MPPVSFLSLGRSATIAQPEKKKRLSDGHPEAERSAWGLKTGAMLQPSHPAPLSVGAFPKLVARWRLAIAGNLNWKHRRKLPITSVSVPIGI